MTDDASNIESVPPEESGNQGPVETGGPPRFQQPEPTPQGGRRLYEYLHAPAPPLEQCLDTFWSPSGPLEDLPEIPSPPDEPYEILKRLGPSPFEGSSFPLIGFFASTYERVSRFASQRTRL